MTIKKSVQLNVKVIIYVDKATLKTNIVNDLNNKLFPTIRDYINDYKIEANKYKILLECLIIYESKSYIKEDVNLTVTEKEFLSKLKQILDKDNAEIETLFLAYDKGNKLENP